MDIDSADLETSPTTVNPLHDKPSSPSSAYLESQKRSRESSSSVPDRNPVNHHVRPGLRTILTASILFGGGLLLVILGSVVFIDSERGGEVVTKSQGLDLLIIGAVSK